MVAISESARAGSSSLTRRRRTSTSTFASGQPQRADVGLLHPGQSPTGLRVRTWLTAAQQGARETRTEPQCVMFLHDLRELEARLRTEKLAAMGRMSAAVAHEIRNPLAAIVQANALLGEDLSDPAQQRLCHMVQQNAERLARIAEEVLDIARVQNQISHAPAASLALGANELPLGPPGVTQDDHQAQGDDGHAAGAGQGRDQYAQQDDEEAHAHQRQTAHAPRQPRTGRRRAQRGQGQGHGRASRSRLRPAGRQSVNA